MNQADVRRFLAKFERRGDAECWPWNAARGDKGYGRFHLRGRLISACRAAVELDTGEEVAPDLVVMHACDNPPCVNPAHLRIGTHADNDGDKRRKGREFVARGERHGNAALTAAQVLEIRSLSGRGVRRETIAADFGVTARTVGKIVRRERWDHVAAPDPGTPDRARGWKEPKP